MVHLPLAETDLLEGRSEAELDAISDAVHEANREPRTSRRRMVENGREDWSFGRGQASYLELPRDAWR